MIKKKNVDNLRTVTLATRCKLTLRQHEERTACTEPEALGDPVAAWTSGQPGSLQRASSLTLPGSTHMAQRHHRGRKKPSLLSYAYKKAIFLPGTCLA